MTEANVRTKNLSPLPKGWRWVRLGEVIQYIGNGTTAKQNKDGRGTPVTRMETIANEIIDSTRVGYIDNPDETLLKKYRLTPGDILFSHINSDPHLGKTALYEGDPPILIHGMNLLRVVPRKEALSSKYLNFLFRHYRNAGYFLEIAQRAIGQSSINQKKMRDLLIPLPPLEEQRRIVARIEELMSRVREARRLRQEALEDTERLWQSVLSETFPQPGSDLPEGWRWVRLGEVFCLRNGKFIRGGNLSAGGGIPVYGANGLLGFTATPLLTQGKTIVIGRVGTCGAVNVVEAPCWISDNAMYVSQWHTDCDIEYIALALRSIDLSTFAKKGTQPSISQEAVYTALIPLPPLDEQRRIVAHLEAVQEKIRALKSAQSEMDKDLNRLEQAILDKAFRGEL